jgi:cytochrome c oxidase subunit 2
MMRITQLLHGMFVRRQLVCGILMLSMLALLIAGCDVDTPQNTFDPKGDVADQQKDVFLYAMWPALIIMIGVLVATVVIVLRFRSREGDPIPKQTHGNTKLEIAWTIAPAILLLGLGIPMVATLWDIGRDPSDDAFPVVVEGQRFSWVFTYPDVLDENGAPVMGFSGAGDSLVIPAGREVSVTLQSIDVIHSFWVPKLAGKLDAIPGRHNTMWLIADEPGSFSGQCAELCGVGHGDMVLSVTALADEDFQSWLDEMMFGVAESDGADEEEADSGS